MPGIKKTFLIVLLPVYLFSAVFQLLPDEREQYHLILDFYHDGFYEFAESNARDFLKNWGQSVYIKQVTYHLAMSLLKQKRYSDAYTHLTWLADDTSFPLHADVIYYCALTAHLLDDSKNSGRFIGMALRLTTDPIRIEKLKYYSIKHAISTGDGDRALQEALDYFEVSSYSRYRLEIEKYLADYFIETRDYRNAAQIAEIMLAEKRLDQANEAIMRYNYLLALRQLGKYDKAIAFFSRLPDRPDYQLLLLMADIYTAMKRYSEAVTVLEQAWGRSGSTEVLEYMARVILVWRGVVPALKVMQRVGPTTVTAPFLADLYYQSGNRQRCYDLLVGLDRSTLQPESLLLLFTTAKDLQKWQTIAGFYSDRQRFYELPEDRRGSMLYILGETLYNRATFDKAIVVFSEWLAEYVHDERGDAVLFMLGTALKEQGKLQDATVVFTRIQKLRKKDRLYYESFVEKGELLFELYEYHAAIEQYKVYLANKVTKNRRKEILLQTGNASYNIKRFDDAVRWYKICQKEFGSSAYIDRKLGNTLLRQEKYKDLRKTFGRRKKVSDYIAYLLVYAGYKDEDFADAVAEARRRNLPTDSEYYFDVLYLSIYSLNELKDYDAIVNEYTKLSGRGVLSDRRNKKESVIEKMRSINELFFKALVKMGEINKSHTVFTGITGTETVAFQAEVYFRNLYFDQADVLFAALRNNPGLARLEIAWLYTMVEASRLSGNYPAALQVLDHLIESQGTSVALVVKKIDIMREQGDTTGLATFKKSLINVDLIRYCKIVITLINSRNTSTYRRSLKEMLQGRNIEQVLTQALLLDLVRLEYEEGDYKEVIKTINKIPDAVLSRISAEFKYHEAGALLKLNKDKKALAEYLKIYYLFSYDSFWVEKSIRNVLDIYKRGNDMAKYNKTKEMFESKYFILH